MTPAAHQGALVLGVAQLALVPQLQAHGQLALGDPAGHEQLGWLGGTGGMHGQGAQGLAQQIDHLFGGLGAGGVHQQPAGLAVQIGADPARAGEGAGQEIQHDLIAQLTALLAADGTCLAILHLGDLFVQALGHHRGGQQPLLAAGADQEAVSRQVGQGSGTVAQGRGPAQGGRLQGAAGAEAALCELLLDPIRFNRGWIIQPEQSDILEHGAYSRQRERIIRASALLASPGRG